MARASRSKPVRQALIGVAAWLWSASMLSGQGGPPMITDDPGTPGDGKWEINVAGAFEHRPTETLFDSPGIDLNYGVGEHIQLTLQGGPVVLKRSERGPIGGIGGTEAAMKWRFADEEGAGLDISIFPRIIFNVTQSSVRRGLAEDGTRFQMPVEVARSFGHVHIDAECGPVVSTVGRSEWLYGIVGGADVAKKTSVMAELHGTSRINFSHNSLAVNVGVRHELTSRRILIASLGHEIYSADQPRALIGYLGIQLVY